MGCRPEKLLWVFGSLILALLSMDGGGVVRVSGSAMVTGTVYCDQCKDGDRGLFDYPLYGARVAVACGGGADGAEYKEATTNWFGCYTVRFDGSPDLSRCSAKVVGAPAACGAAAGPAQGLSLVFQMFGMEMYTADPLLSQPPQPMAMCPSAGGRRSPQPPPFRAPPVPFLEAAACPYYKWTMPQYRCHWKVVGPDTKVAVAFGLVAAGKYGTDMSLMEGLHGRGDLYRTLLREGTTALLNSYNSLGFMYPTLSVINHMNIALLGSPTQALMAALRFRRANSGTFASGRASCNFIPCS